MPTASTPSPATDTSWISEPDGNGFYRVVNSKSVVLAQKCVCEEAILFAAAPDLLEACFTALTEPDEYIAEQKTRAAIAKAQGSET